MQNLRRNIKLFWAENGKLLLQIIGSIAVIIFVIQMANQYAKTSNEKKQEEILKNKDKIEQQQLIKKEEEEKVEYINKFIDNCNNKKIDEAYKMLSEKCKNEKYPSVLDFKTKYVDKIFNYKKDCEITLENQVYKVTYLEDVLQSGKLDGRDQIIDYFNVEEDILGEKSININLYNNI